ncbi:MAG: hypothetical protein KC620_04835 [Myxococcales bacterium]|nr:hypothetical protein [Myxococcales bacterium]
MEDDAVEFYRLEGRRALLLQMLRGAFPRLSEADVDRVRHAPAEALDRWSERLYGALGPDEVFAEERSAERQRNWLRKRLAVQFDPLAPHRRAMVAEADTDALDRWLRRLRTATSPDEIFALTPGDRLWEKGFARRHLAVRCAVRFGPLPPWAQARVHRAELPDLAEWVARLAEAETLPAVFGEAFEPDEPTASTAPSLGPGPLAPVMDEPRRTSAGPRPVAHSNAPQALATSAR